MSKLFLILFSLLLISTSCFGCSFIKEKVLQQPARQQTFEGDSQQEYQEDEDYGSKPIPVNPPHS